MKNAKVALIALIAVFSLSSASPALAAGTAPATDKNLSAKVMLGEVLTSAQQNNQTVQIVLRNGTLYNAKVKDVSKHAVVLTNLSGKSFFDAYVLLSEVASVEIQMRNN